MKDLRETIGMMISSDFKDRVKAEYHQLAIRCEKLEAMCQKYAAGELDFKPNCPLELLKEQLGYMQDYKTVLEIRAEIEHIDLNEEVNGNGTYWATVFGDAEGRAIELNGDSYELLDGLSEALAMEMAGSMKDSSDNLAAFIPVAETISEYLKQHKPNIKGKIQYADEAAGDPLKSAVFPEKERDLEQEYAEQAESEQACEACEECCDCCNDTGTAEPAENKKTDNEDCTPPVDSEGNSGLDGLLGFLKDKASEAMAKKVADMDLKVLIEKTDEGVCTELRGNPVALISELVTAMAHIIAGCPDKKMQEFMKEAAMEELEEEIADLQKEQKKK